MNLRLNDAEVRDLIVSDVLPNRREELLSELAQRTSYKLQLKKPSRTGKCRKHGKRIQWDDRGAMASGYPIHVGESGYCDDWQGITNDPVTEYSILLNKEIDRLKLFHKRGNS